MGPSAPGQITHSLAREALINALVEFKLTLVAGDQSVDLFIIRHVAALPLQLARSSLKDVFKHLAADMVHKTNEEKV